MSSIDNRIVILTFDNKNFEKNVQTSMSTLDKLKNGLKFDGATKGLDKLSSSAKAINLNPIGSAIESIRDRFTNLGIVGMTVLQNLTNTAVDFGKRLISSMIAPLTQGGWKRALNIEQATFQMEGLIGKTENGAEKIKAIMESVKTSVQGTAYGMDEAARVASQLVATGVEDSQLMLKYLQGVAGAAAMTGGAYDEIGHIFTTVAGQGKLMTEQINQFAYRGLNIAATLSKQMNITEAEFRDLVKKGKISFDEFAEGMANAFGEHATKANETFTGSLANMKAALARIGEEFASPALKYFRDIFYSLKLLIDQVHERLKPLIALINDQLIGNAAKLVDFIDSVTELLGGESQRMKKAAEETAEATEETAERVKVSAEEIEQAAQKVLAGEYGNGDERRRQLEELGLSYERVQNRVNELLGCSYRYEVHEDELTESIKEGGDATRDTADAMDELKEKTEAWQDFLAKRAWYDFVAALKNIAGAIKGFGGAGVEAFKEMFTSDTGTAFIKGIGEIANHFNLFTRELKLNEDQANGLKNIFKGLFWVIEQGVKLVGKFVDFGITIAGGIVGLGKRFLGFIGTIDLFNGEIDETSRKGQLILALRGVFDKLSSSLTVFKSKVKLAWLAFKNSDAFQTLKANAERLWEVMRDLGGKVMDAVTKKMKEFIDSDYLPSFDKIMGWFEKGAGYLSKFVGWMADGLPKVRDWFNAFRDSETGKFGKFTDFLIRAKDAIKEFFSGVDTETGELNLFGKLKASISKGLDNLGQFFSDIKTDGFVKGLDQFIQNVSHAFDSMSPESLEKIKQWSQIALAITGVITTLYTVKKFTALFESIGGLTDIFGLKAFAEAYNNRTKIMKFGMILATIATLVGSLWVLSTMDPDRLLHSVEVLTTIVAGIVGIYFLIGKVPVNEKAIRSFGTSMAGLGIGLLAIAGAAKIFSTMDWDDILNSAGKVAVFAGIMALAAKLAGQVKAGAAFMGLAVALNLLLIPIMVLGHTKTRVLEKAAVAIGAFALELGIAARVAGNVKAAAAFMGLAVALNLIIPALLILGHTSWDTIEKGAVSLGLIMAELAIACRIAASEHSGKGAASMIAMAVAVGVVAVSLKVLGEMDAAGLKRGTTALGIIIGELAIVLGVAKGCSSSWGALLAMAGVIAAAVVALHVLADTPWAQLKSGVISMGLVMTAAGKAVRTASQGSFTQQLGGFLAMALTLGAACAALWFLAKQPWESMLAGAISLSALIASLGIALEKMQGTTFRGALKSAAALGLSIDIIVALVGGLVYLAGVIAEKVDPNIISTLQKGSEVLGAVGRAIGEFFGEIVSGFGETVTESWGEMANNLTTMAENLEGFFAKIQEYGTGEMLESVGNFALALLAITGAELLDGIFEFISGKSSLEEFGSELSSFAESFKTFYDTLEGIENFDANKVTTMATVIGELGDAAKHIPNSGASFMKGLLGDNTLDEFGRQLEGFAPGLKKLYDECGNIEEGALKGVASALSDLGKAGSHVENSGLSVLSVLLGDNKLDDFGDQMKGLAPGLRELYDNCGDIPKGALKGVASAIADLGDAGENVQNNGLSVLSVLIGDNDLANFGKEMEGLAPGLQKLYQKCGGIPEGGLSGVASAISSLGIAAGDIENSGGALSWFTGDNSLAAFGAELESFGPSFNIFMGSIQGLNQNRAITFSNVIRSLASVSNQLGVFTSGQMASAGNNLATFGGYIGGFCDNLDKVDINKVDAFATAITNLATAASSLNDDSVAGMSSISSIFTSEIGDGMEAFTTEMESAQSGMQAAVTSALESVGKAVTGTGKATLSIAFQKLVIDVTKDFVQGFKRKEGESKSAAQNFINAAKNGIPSDFASKFQQTGTNAAVKFCSAISARNTTAYSAAAGLVSSASSGLNSSANSGAWYQVGAHLANGLVQGLGNSSALRAAAERAANLVRTAKRAAEVEGQIKSPSRVFYRIGNYLVEGLVNAMEDGVNDASKAGADLASSAIKQAQSQMSRLKDVLNLDADFSPVITPVVDLSEVQAGARSIDQILGTGPFGLSLGNDLLLNRLSLMTNSSNDNNKDVVNAINGLKDKGLGKTTINITVDGAENPEDFVDRMVRSLKGYSRI